MTQPTIIIQASSRSWSGGPDLCLNLVDGEPAVHRTVERALEHFPQSRLIIAAPEYDRGGQLDRLSKKFSADMVSVYYGQDDSPLNRMLAVTEGLTDEALILRIDGLHFCFDVIAAREMLQQAEQEKLDAVKLPDDFPVQFGADIYRIGALRQLDELLMGVEMSPFRVHPKFFLFSNKERFQCAYSNYLPNYSDDYLRQCRERALSIYAVPRLEVNTQRLWVGDQLSFHYELAERYLRADMKVLDIACGDGYGARRISPSVAEIHGGDIDLHNVAHARQLTIESNVYFHVEDVAATSFANDTFDAVLCMETIEHVDDVTCLKELRRILRPGGILILSTPQSSLGHIPINPQHRQEYSLERISELCAAEFVIREAIGIKAGRIVIDGDPLGANIVLVCEKAAA